MGHPSVGSPTLPKGRLSRYYHNALPPNLGGKHDGGCLLIVAFATHTIERAPKPRSQPGVSNRGYRLMNTYAPSVERKLQRENRLDAARTLYNALVAQHPDWLIILCDEHARVVARSLGDVGKALQ